MTREPDRFDSTALDVYLFLFQPRRECHAHAKSYLCGICRDHIAAALRAEHEAAQALELAAHRLEEIARDYEGRKLRSLAMDETVEAAFLEQMARAAWRCVKAVYALIPPAAVNAAEGECWSDVHWCAQHGQPLSECTAQGRAAAPAAEGPLRRTVHGEEDAVPGEYEEPAAEMGKAPAAWLDYVGKPQPIDTLLRDAAAALRSLGDSPLVRDIEATCIALRAAPPEREGT